MPSFFSPKAPLRGLFLILCVFSTIVPISRVQAASLEERLGISVFDAREKAPEISAPDLSGHDLRLSDFRGKVILLNFWATWCDPCRKEIPSLIALQKKLSAEPFVVVSVAMDRRIAHIAPFAGKYHISYPVLEGRKGKVDSRYYGLGLPQTYVIDKNGTLIGRVVGGRDWDSPDSVSYFTSLAGKARTAGAGTGKEME